MRFLSEEHLTAVSEALAKDGEVVDGAQGVDLGLNYVISNSPDGDFTYHIVVREGAASMGRGEVTDPDANLQSSYDTAAKISRGETTSQMAVMTGKIKVRGSVGTIMKHTKLLAKIESHANQFELEY